MNGTDTPPPIITATALVSFMFRPGLAGEALKGDGLREGHQYARLERSRRSGGGVSLPIAGQGSASMAQPLCRRVLAVLRARQMFIAPTEPPSIR